MTDSAGERGAVSPSPSPNGPYQAPATAELQLPRFGTALDPDGYDLAEAIERHECRPAHKSHPNHCGHCYYPWPCPSVVLYRRLIGNG